MGRPEGEPEQPAGGAADGHGMPPDPFTMAEENAASLTAFYRWLRSGGMPILGAAAFIAANVIYQQGNLGDTDSGQ